MKINKTIVKYRKHIFLAIATWWSIAFLLAFVQAYFMSGNPAFIPLAIIFPIVLFFINFGIYKKLEKGKTWAITIVYFYATLHFIPLALQFTGIQPPGIDNIITAVIGLLLITLAR